MSNLASSLAAKLLLSFLAVVVVGILAVAYLASRATDAQFESYVIGGATLRSARIAEAVSGYYGAAGNWTTVGPVLDGLARGTPERLVLADSEGRVVADTAGDTIGQPARGLGLGEGVAIEASGKVVGRLYVVAAGGGMGRGPGAAIGRGRRGVADSPGTTAIPVRSPEESFLDNVSRELWLAALLAILIALSLALLLTRQIVRPLRLLAAAAARLATGDLSHRVPVPSTDELGKLAASFNAMAEALEKNEVARRHLMADVAHELRTPLSVIEGTSDAMLDGVFDLTAENVRVIKEQAGLLTKLIGDLRDLSLAEAGQLPLTKESVDVVALAGRALQSHDAAAREKGVSLALEAPRPVPAIEADPERLTQVLGNLIGNALRHTPGGGSIVLGVHQAPLGLRVAVADTGEGIAPEDLPQVFDRFYRADKSRARRSGGSGLGLSIARQIVTAHGGTIWVDSPPGSGATFTFELPEGCSSIATSGV